MTMDEKNAYKKDEGCNFYAIRPQNNGLLYQNRVAAALMKNNCKKIWALVNISLKNLIFLMCFEV